MATMEPGESGRAMRVRIYSVENATWRGRSLNLAVLELLRREGCAGATAFNGVMGFGQHGRLRTGAIVDAAIPLPQVIEWVDRPVRVRRILPLLQEMVGEALITVEEVRAVQFPRRELRDIAAQLRVRDVMTPGEEVDAVLADAGLDELVALLLRRGRHAVPVIDRERRVVGIVTEDDLIARAGLSLRLALLRTLGDPDDPAVAAHLTGLRGEGRTAATIMTTAVMTVAPEMSVALAAERLLQRPLRQAPVVDQTGRLVGILSRFDILRTAANTDIRPDSPPVSSGDSAHEGVRLVGEALRQAVPTVRTTTLLPEVLDAVASTRLHCAVVVDDAGCPVGIVADTDLLRRITPAARPGLVRRLAHQFRAGSPQEREDWQRLTGQRADEVMHPRDEMLVVSTDTPLADAIDRALATESYHITVVNEAGRLVGMANRADLVAALARAL